MIKKSKKKLSNKIDVNRSKFFLTVLIISILLFSIMGNVTSVNLVNRNDINLRYNYCIKNPIGDPKGVNPGRVVWVWNPDATEKNLTGYWWYSENNNQTIINQMFSKGLKKLTDAKDDEEAWSKLFRYFNRIHGNGDQGYQNGEKIAIKVNLANNKYDSYENEDNEFDANPYVVKALLGQLVNKAGVPEEDITIFDASTLMQDWFYNLVASDFPNVYYADLKGEAEGREKVISSETRVYFAWGRCKYRTLPKCVTEADYIINMPLLKRHPIKNGITLSGKNFFGCFMEEVSPLHRYMQWGSIMGHPAPQTDLLGHKDLGLKTLLLVGDGTFATRKNIKDIGKFQMYPFDDDWTNSLFFSQDSVALDSVMYDFLRVEGTHPSKGSHNYLHQAANPPSNVYDPENDGVFLSESLGVHEHCDKYIDIFSSQRYSGPDKNGIDYIPLGEEYASFSVDILKPMRKTLTISGNMIKPLRKYNTTVIVGKIKVRAQVNCVQNSIDRVEFYLNDVLKNTDYDEPYEWLWNKPSFMKLSTLEVKAYGDNSCVIDEINVWKLF